jgi:hypothetical protein
MSSIQRHLETGLSFEPSQYAGLIIGLSTIDRSSLAILAKKHPLSALDIFDGFDNEIIAIEKMYMTIAMELELQPLEIALARDADSVWQEKIRNIGDAKSAWKTQFLVHLISWFEEMDALKAEKGNGGKISKVAMRWLGGMEKDRYELRKELEGVALKSDIKEIKVLKDASEKKKRAAL